MKDEISDQIYAHRLLQSKDVKNLISSPDFDGLYELLIL